MRCALWLLAGALGLASACDSGVTGTTSRGVDGPEPRGGSDGGASDPDTPPARDAGSVTPLPPDAGGGTPPSTPAYPAGPYGTSVGSTMPDLWFVRTDGSEITWGDIRNDPSVKVIVWGSGAGWCGPCRTEAAKMSSLHDRYAARGVYVLESLFEDDFRNQATAEYAQEWKTGLRCNHEVVAEPDPPYGEADAIPMLWIIDAETMRIVRYANGLEPGIEAEIDALLR